MYITVREKHVGPQMPLYSTTAISHSHNIRHTGSCHKSTFLFWVPVLLRVSLSANQHASNSAQRHSSLPLLVVSISQAWLHLGGSTADEEPLVDRTVDLARGELLVGGERGELVRADAAGGVADVQVGATRKSEHGLQEPRNFC